MAERQKMSAAKRAKQFMPFAALKGFEEALEKAETEMAEQADSPEIRKEELYGLMKHGQES
ncbi:MAG: hypothetical protein IKY53_06935 [Lachnospiraceae bacterium]|nr:hypothetical protein [Lachnospiraceae bacterium]